MKNSLMSIADKILLRKRTLIETVNDELKNIAQIEHSKHRSFSNHSIFRHDNFIGCFSADKIKMSARKYFCFNIPIDKNMAEGLFCRSPYHEEYIQTSASGNPEDLCH